MKRKSVVETVLLILALLAGYMAFLVSCESKLIYHPHKYPAGAWDAGSYGVKAEDVYFQSSDGVKLHGWFVPARGATATLLWFHGNAGNITHRLDNILRLRPLNLNIFIFDYRGYGRSQGDPDERGLYVDSIAAYDALVHAKNIAPERLFLFGRSLGGVCAVEVASQRPAAGLILESAFTNAKDMVGTMFPFLPLGYFVKSEFDALGKIRAVRIPKLFLHGTEDRVVPYRLGRKLFEAAAEPKEFYDIRGAGHNDTYIAGGKAYFEALGQFVKQTLAAAQGTRAFPKEL
ncbi:MAG: alpha/beta hydrolase [Nitrospinales bacterium]